MAGLKTAGAALCFTEGLLSAARYVSLHTADPTAANELDGHAYARPEHAPAGWTVVAGTGVASNSAALAYAAPTDTWADPTHAALQSAAAAGDMLWSAALGADVDAPVATQSVLFPAGDLTVALDDGAVTLAGRLLCLQGGLLAARRWFSLHSGDPGDAGDDELQGGGYGRVEVDPAHWTVDGGTATLDAARIFPRPSSAWNDATWLALRSAANAGDVLWRRAFTNDPDAAVADGSVSLLAQAVSIVLATDG